MQSPRSHRAVSVQSPLGILAVSVVPLRKKDLPIPFPMGSTETVGIPNGDCAESVWRMHGDCSVIVTRARERWRFVGAG